MSTGLLPRASRGSPFTAPFAALAQTLSSRAAPLSSEPPAWHAAVRARLRTPHPEQVRFITSPAKRKVIRAGRRGGKTVGTALIALQGFLAGRRILYAVPTQEQVDQFWFETKRALEPAIDAGHVLKNETRHLLEIPRTRIRIRAKTAWNSDTLRGDSCDLLILDEFQLMAEDAWGLVGAPMLLDNDGDAIFVYTPPSMRSLSVSKAQDKRHAAKLYKSAALDTTGRWATFHFTSHANPYLSTRALDDITGDMTALAHRQEILAEDTEDVPGALWTQAGIDADRLVSGDHPPLVRIAIALDPSATSRETSDEMGLIAGGCSAHGHGYVLRDASMRGTPATCARQAIRLYDALQADVIVAEVNNGGEWIETVIQFVAAEMYRQGERTTRTVSYKMVHASRGKQTRAEPIAAEYEHHRIHHVGVFPELEQEMCSWVPGMASPNRMDAVVWLQTELLLGARMPRDISLAPAVDLRQRPFTERVVHQATTYSRMIDGAEGDDY